MPKGKKKSGRKPKKVQVVMVGGSLWDDISNVAKNTNDYLRKSKIISTVAKPLGSALSIVPIPGVSTAGTVIKTVGGVADQFGYGGQRGRGFKL
jgi:hypothetical protein